MSARARRARSAATRITKALHLPGVSLLHVAISTGRTHQIRVHLSEIGHPIVGDAVYGGLRRRVPATCGRCSRSSARSCTPAAWCFTIRPTDAGWSSKRRCRHDLQSVLDLILPEDYERSTS